MRLNFAPEMVRSDVTTFKAQDWPDVDIFHAGFPCQTFSSAGKCLGDDDVRGQIVYHIKRLIKVKRPRVALLENVRGLLQEKFKPLFDWLIKSLKEMGYHVEYRLLNARYHAVPQNRERVIVLAVLKEFVQGDKFPWPANLLWAAASWHARLLTSN